MRHQPQGDGADLDSTDPKWTSRRCVAARKAVYEFDDHRTVRAVVGVAGNAVVPFAGTATSLALGASQSKTRKRLNHQVESACISRHRRKRSA
ncbi:MAG: hypothetical protein WDM92_11235 [Caulobacteraceae bacterium]